MAEIYSDLQVSPRKKKRSPPDFDSNTHSPKKLRTAPSSPPPTISRKPQKTQVSELPEHLSRLYNVQTGLQHALSHSLATCAVSPSSDTGIVRNVLTHQSLSTAGFAMQFNLDDLHRLCWIWEWDGKSLDGVSEADEDNPFCEKPSTSVPKDWTRGGMGTIISQATHHAKSESKRVPAYGIGIEVEMDIDKDMAGGMAAVARWTAASETRREEFRQKLVRWVELHEDADPIPSIPLADLPKLNAPAKTSTLTKIFASVSPKAASHIAKMPDPPSSPTSPSKSAYKSPLKKLRDGFAVPFPVTPSRTPTKKLAFPIIPPPRSESPTKNPFAFPQTPSRRSRRESDASLILTPRTPRVSDVSLETLPSTPVHQRGSSSSTAPETPTTSRRQALYERVRQRSLSASPTKSRIIGTDGITLTRDQMLKLGQEELRRRCLLGRLGGVAESAWMMFATPVTTASSSMTRKRRALPQSEVAASILKSSPVPISIAEANESLEMLVKMCPFFLKQINIGRETWLEMPTMMSENTSNLSSTTEDAKELLTRSPRRVKQERGGLREVREIIRRELELNE